MSQDPMPQPPAPSRRTQVISAAVTIATLGIVFFYLFPKFGSYEQALAYVRSMSTTAIAFYAAAVILNIFVYVWPFLVALPGLRFGPGFVVRQTSFMISNTIPAGGALGLAVQYRMLGSYGFGAGATTSAIGINSLWNILVTIGMPAIGTLALIISGSWAGQGLAIGLVSLVVIMVAVFVLKAILGSAAGARRVGLLLDRWVKWGLRVIRKPREIDVTAAVMNLRESMYETVNDRWGRLTVSNVSVQLTSWLVLFVALRGIQAEAGPLFVTWSECLAAFSLARLATFIPITPGGLGTVDAALTTLLTNFGATPNQALAATLLWRAGTFVPQAALGVVTLIWWRATRRRRMAAASPL